MGSRSLRHSGSSMALADHGSLRYGLIVLPQTTTDLTSLLQIDSGRGEAAYLYYCTR
jgi:hypothetical protein